MKRNSFLFEKDRTNLLACLLRYSRERVLKFAKKVVIQLDRLSWDKNRFKRVGAVQSVNFLVQNHGINFTSPVERVLALLNEHKDNRELSRLLRKDILKAIQIIASNRLYEGANWKNELNIASLIRFRILFQEFFAKFGKHFCASP